MEQGGGLSPPEPSSVRPSQRARRREQSGGLGAAGGGSDGSGGGDREIRKPGLGGSQGGVEETPELGVWRGWG